MRSQTRRDCFMYEINVYQIAVTAINLQRVSDMYEEILFHFLPSERNFVTLTGGGIHLSERRSLVSIRTEKQGAYAQAPVAKTTDLDCETAALLRAAIRPIFSNAANWGSLAETLKEKGYSLVFRQGRLCLTDTATDARVCGLNFLGFEFRDLVRRLGRPIVVPRGDHADGEVLTTRPNMGRI